MINNIKNMLLKVLVLVILVQTVIVLCYQHKFMIRNKKTGQVLSAGPYFVEIEYWGNKNTQLWTIENSRRSGYFYVHNVGTKEVMDASPETKDLLVYPKHGGETQMWKINSGGIDTELQVLYYPSDIMIQEGLKPILNSSRPTDASDRWVLVLPEAP